VVKDGVLRTNDQAADILLGVTRASILELAGDHAIPVSVGPLTVDDLATADEVFFTGTAAEVTPLSCIDERTYRTDGPVVTKLRDAYLRAVRGEDERHLDWVTFAREQTPVAGAI
jgi:branched-chain amino acid aminotransferase